MKKIYFTLFAIAVAINFSFAQWTNQSGTGNYYLTSGHVGIGTSTPTDALDIFGNNPVIRLTENQNNGTVFLQKLSNAYGGWLRLYDGSTYSMRWLNGNVSVGMSDNSNWQLATSPYLFAVGGSMIATAVTVKPTASWPDYVFKKTFKLPSLTETEAYIGKNQRLPEMPSEQQIAKDGLNLGEMNKLLVKKVEELTLYLIELNKQVKEQQKEIDLLKIGHKNP